MLSTDAVHAKAFGFRLGLSILALIALIKARSLSHTTPTQINKDIYESLH
jgi:hypothetical protein